MTGGSYDYLCYRATPDHLEAMADRLAELAPGSAAARDTATLVALFRSERLREVWRAVEWLDSEDYSPNLAQAAIAGYGNGGDAPGAEDGCVCRTAGTSWLRWFGLWRR